MSEVPLYDVPRGAGLAPARSVRKTSRSAAITVIYFGGETTGYEQLRETAGYEPLRKVTGYEPLTETRGYEPLRSGGWVQCLRFDGLGPGVAARCLALSK